MMRDSYTKYAIGDNTNNRDWSNNNIILQVIHIILMIPIMQGVLDNTLTETCDQGGPPRYAYFLCACEQKK